MTNTLPQMFEVSDKMAYSCICCNNIKAVLGSLVFGGSGKAEYLGGSSKIQLDPQIQKNTKVC